MNTPGDRPQLERFKQTCREIVDIRSVFQLLSWDQETMMPSGGANSRARQVSTIALALHNRVADPSFGCLIAALEEEGAADAWRHAEVKEARRLYDRAVRLPGALVQELAETAALGYEAWIEARHRSDFQHFRPWLEKLTRLKREEARCLQMNVPLYDALLDEYEPGMTSERLDALFSELQPFLTQLLCAIQESGRTPAHLPQAEFSAPLQERFGREVLTAMGFDWKSGRLDVSPHPFCTGLSPEDVRITTRYSSTELLTALFGMIHEAGHALYEQGLDAERYGSLACDAVSLGVHESQSRLWENQVGRSAEFWMFWFPRLQAAFPAALSGWSPDAFLRAVNRVEASCIRIEADEVTYGLHVILRYELERGLIEDNLRVEDLPDAWNERMRRYLGLTPSDAAQGVLQDTHWSQGMFGYFPTYVLGNILAAQILHGARRSIPDLSQRIRAGDLLSLREWLREKVHRPGKTLSADEVLVQTSGEPMNTVYFTEYLREKFNHLYEL